MRNVLNCTSHELKIPNVVDSEGVYVFDENGKRYMDLESGVWCTALGHKNSRINRAIQRQIDSIMHVGFCYSNEILDEAAESILSITSLEGGKSVFLSSGSEAIEISRQITAHVTGKQRTLTLHDAYLGAYASVINRKEGWHSFNWDNCKTCSKKGECDSDCGPLQSIPEGVSEFIFEPGSAMSVEEGEFVIVPRGVEHCPKADEEVHVLLFEPADAINTGDAGGDRTVTDPGRV
ncbi:MAG: aminotransferase class III-fold pyridoxal phosphate-dependent enzyme [Planctomycetota bacterium]|jgi:acetylornithine aminotransferase